MSMAGESNDEHGGYLDWVWTPWGDHAAEWRDAENASVILNHAARDLGLSNCDVAAPHTGPHGEGVVWMRPGAVRKIGYLLALLAGEGL
jgi:hypothetical protein